MIIWAVIYFLGLAAIVAGFVHLVKGIRKKQMKRILLAVALPALLWLAIYALYEADRRFVKEEIRKNGGKLPAGKRGHV